MTSVTYSNIPNILCHMHLLNTHSRNGYPSREATFYCCVLIISYLPISYHILRTDQRNSLKAREYTVNCFCDHAHDVQMEISSGSGVGVDTGVENTDAQ